ncbi:hypothetical protein [Streptomyces sp. R08]|uniref:Scaffolding protein n=1 Tax=Streptomyces sp. R08 TaxID=3238624 RepID=A0AB39MDW9_9ACTN
MADENTETGTENNETGEETAATTEGAKPDEGADETQLGDAGKKALSEERTARKAAEKELAEAKAEAARLRRSNAATKGTDLEAIKTEMREEFAAQLVSAEIKAEAKGRLTDVGDVTRYPEYFEGIKAGDEKAITAAVDKLLKEKPYLAAAEDTRKGWGDVGGTQRKAAQPEPETPIERLRRSYSN